MFGGCPTVFPTTVSGLTKPGGDLGDKGARWGCLPHGTDEGPHGDNFREGRLLLMCGIVGYVGSRPALPIILDGLERLEYRGYDSAGVAVLGDGRMMVHKQAGRLADLKNSLCEGSTGCVGLGHTRWATHGRPSDANAHPHLDCSGQVLVVHNGIIENHAELRAWLERHHHRFRSETDTEVIPHLIEHYWEGDLEGAVRKAVRRLEGSFALVVASTREPDKLVVVRQESPLILGLGEDEFFVASDIPAILHRTRRTIVLENGEMAVIDDRGPRVTDWEGAPVDKPIIEVSWDPVTAERGGYPHFMLKEIHEQPDAVRETLRGRIAPAGGVNLAELQPLEELLRSCRRVYMTACGTACHAAMVGKMMLESWVRIPVEVDLASEFRYRDLLLEPEDLVVVVSQSGETADTLAALREAQHRGSQVVAVTNVLGSSVAREADAVIYTRAGPEIAVASTKAYMTQLVVLALLALHMAQLRGTMTPDRIARRCAELESVPDRLKLVLQHEPMLERLGGRLRDEEHVFFIGRGADYRAALEGQLKLKEISYIHAEAYAAGELKHGTLALITEGVPVVALATQRQLLPKIASNIAVARARGGWILAVGLRGATEIQQLADEYVPLPELSPLLMPMLAAVPLQLLAYYAARARGCDIDKPRNLAKSVTVEG